jgi:hypothetical protein
MSGHRPTVDAIDRDEATAARRAVVDHAALGTEGDAVGSVLDIAAGDDASVVNEARDPDVIVE